MYNHRVVLNTTSHHDDLTENELETLMDELSQNESIDDCIHDETVVDDLLEFCGSQLQHHTPQTLVQHVEQPITTTTPQSTQKTQQPHESHTRFRGVSMGRVVGGGQTWSVRFGRTRVPGASTCTSPEDAARRYDAWILAHKPERCPQFLNYCNQCHRFLNPYNRELTPAQIAADPLCGCGVKEMLMARRREQNRERKRVKRRLEAEERKRQKGALSSVRV